MVQRIALLEAEIEELQVNIERKPTEKKLEKKPATK
jgi:uncharacterized small protein (DUF1192 family)